MKTTHNYPLLSCYVAKINHDSLRLFGVRSRVRMFAGPNGSGKSELLQRLQNSDLYLGPIVNADTLLKRLVNSGFVDLQDYGLKNVGPDDWDLAIENIQEISTRIEKAGEVPRVQIKEDTLICDGSYLNAYSAALITDFIRYMMVEQRISFSFETVMSHPGKIVFLQKAKKEGYKTYLYFIATDDPRINVSRVRNRVEKGGHPVPEQKIIARYKRSLNLLYEALKTTDRAYILDNSKRRSSVIFEKSNDGKGYLKVKNYPRWFEKAVIEKLE